MSVNLNKKNEQLRSKLRKKELYEHFERVRIQALRQQQKSYENCDEKMICEINDSVKLFMRDGQFQQIYFQYCQTNATQNLKMLAKETCLELFESLSQNLQRYECMFVLKYLIEASFDLIFFDDLAYSQRRMLTIHKIFQLIRQYLQEMPHSTDKSKQQELKSASTIYLDCILLIIIHCRKVEHENYISREIYSMASTFCLWQGLAFFSENALYLVILVIVQMETHYSLQNEFLEFINMNPFILHNLINQIAPFDYTKPVSFPSLLLVNLILKNILNKNGLIISILPSYLKSIKEVYSQNQEGSMHKSIKSYININHFEDMVNNLTNLLKSVCELTLEVNLGTVFKETNFWDFIYCLLRVQAKSVRQTLFEWMELAIRNMAINKIQLQKEVQQEIYYFLVEGLDKYHPVSNLHCLKILLTLLHQASASSIILNNFDEYNIASYLVPLEKSGNSEISQLASQVTSILSRLNMQQVYEE